MYFYEVLTSQPLGLKGSFKLEKNGGHFRVNRWEEDNFKRKLIGLG